MHQTLDDPASASLDPLDRAARTAAVKASLEACQQQLDELDLWQAGAHLSMALSVLEPDA